MYNSKITWQQEIICSSILWLMIEHNITIMIDTMDTNFSFVEDELQVLYNNKFISISGDNYIPTERGQQVITNLVAMYDQIIRFQVFNSVDLVSDYTKDVMDEDGNVLDDNYDPRFGSDSEYSKDLRLAMMQVAVKSVNDDPDIDNRIELDPNKAVFLQKLVDGKITKGTPTELLFDMKLGNIFKEIENIVSSAYKWEHLGDGNNKSWDLANLIYSSGMIEMRKREGNICSSCEIPLGAYEAQLENGESLDECPNCSNSFISLTESKLLVEYECPNCNGNIYSGQSTCTSCGAHINFSLPLGSATIGTVEKNIEETIDNNAGCYYGYLPYGYYNPFYPTADIIALFFLCGEILI